MKGAAPQQSPAWCWRPWAPGSGLSMLLQQSEERRALRAPAQHFLVSSVSRVARVSCTVVPVSHGGSSPGWDEDGATLHPVLTHTGTHWHHHWSRCHRSAAWAALNRAGRMHCHASLPQPGQGAAWDRSGYQWLNKAKWDITPSQVRCRVEFLNSVSFYIDTIRAFLRLIFPDSY